MPKKLGRGLPPLIPTPKLTQFTVCEKWIKNLGLPAPPHLDKIQKNSYFFFVKPSLSSLDWDLGCEDDKLKLWTESVVYMDWDVFRRRNVICKKNRQVFDVFWWLLWGTIVSPGSLSFRIYASQATFFQGGHGVVLSQGHSNVLCWKQRTLGFAWIWLPTVHLC